MKRIIKLFKKSERKIASCIKNLISKEVRVTEIKYLSDEIFIQIYFILSEKRF